MTKSPIEQVQEKLDQALMNVKVLNAQVEASKQMISEGMTLALQMRTNIQLFQQDAQDKARSIELLTNKNEELSKQILELQAPPKVIEPEGDKHAQPEQPPA